MEELKEASQPLYVEEYACGESEQSINLTKGTPLVAECQVRCPTRMDKTKMKMKALLLANVKMAGGCKGQGKTQVKQSVMQRNADRN